MGGNPVGNYRRYTAHHLRRLADRQITRLRRRLYQIAKQGVIARKQIKEIVTSLAKRRKKAISKLAGRPIADNHLPLLAVIGENYLDTKIQMAMILYGLKPKTTPIANGETSDVVKLPQGSAWWLIDVENGEQFLGQSPEAAEAAIKDLGRSCLVKAEAIALGIHTNVLAHHNVDATGSRFNDNTDVVPNLYLDHGQLGIGSNNRATAHDKWGSASCSSRA